MSADVHIRPYNMSAAYTSADIHIRLQTSIYVQALCSFDWFPISLIPRLFLHLLLILRPYIYAQNKEVPGNEATLYLRVVSVSVVGGLWWLPATGQAHDSSTELSQVKTDQIKCSYW